MAIPLAIESGSRAWGFPSPDSDFDCRFVFVRRLDDYLSPWSRRDVIELPIDGDYDINGWDLGKALKLMLKGNAVILEWLQSPIAYQVDPVFRNGFLELAQRNSDRRSVGAHYLHLGERQWHSYFCDGRGEVPIKKVFYALRPAAALRWMVQRPSSAVPPMNFNTLIAECDPPKAVLQIIIDLLARKATTRELGSAVLAPELAEFITDEYEAANAWLGDTPRRRTDEAQADVEAFFRQTVRRLWED